MIFASDLLTDSRAAGGSDRTNVNDLDTVFEDANPVSEEFCGPLRPSAARNRC
jgi:hypothetical protein